MPSEIAHPFRLDTSGRVVTVDHPDAQVRQHVLALLNTTPAERVMVPGYGTDIVSLVFGDPDGDEVATQATIMVRDAMALHEPGVGLIRAEPNFGESGENVASIEVEYQRLDAADTPAIANANTAIIGANGSVREIVRG